MAKYYTVRQKDGSLWGVPLEIIAQHRGAALAERGGDLDYVGWAAGSLALFETDAYAAEDWARNNMDWSDVASHAVELEPARPKLVDFEERWRNYGEYRIVER